MIKQNNAHQSSAHLVSVWGWGKHFGDLMPMVISGCLGSDQRVQRSGWKVRACSHFWGTSSNFPFLSTLRLFLLWRPLSSFKFHSAFFCLLCHRQGQGQYHRIWAPSQVIKISLTSRQILRASAAAAAAARKLPNFRALTEKDPESNISRDPKVLGTSALACNWEWLGLRPQKHKQ